MAWNSSRRDAAGAVPGHPRVSRTRAAVRSGQRAPLMARNLAGRIAFAVPAIAVTLVALWLGAWVLATLVAALAVLGTREIYDLARKRGVEPLETLGLAAAAAIPFGTFWVKDLAAWEPVLYGEIGRAHV